MSIQQDSTATDTVVRHSVERCTHFEDVGRRVVFCHGPVDVVERGGRYLTRCRACTEERQFHDNDPECCPSCGVDFQGAAIPEEHWHLFGARHGSRKIGIYDLGRDRTVAWHCPDCKHEWGRG